MSPTVLVVGPHAFRFYSADVKEPPHIHVRTGEKAAKFWLAPVSCAYASGYNRAELNEVERLVVDNEALFLAKWREFFGR